MRETRRLVLRQLLFHIPPKIVRLWLCMKGFSAFMLHKTYW